MADPEVRAEQGEPTALPRGGATQINDILKQASQYAKQRAQETPSAASGSPQEPVQPEVAPEGVPEQVFAEEEDFNYRPVGDEETFLAGPTENPLEDEPNLLPPVPADMDEWVPWINEAADLPGAPEALKAFRRRIAQDIGPA
jgi:hypothetical protein